MPGEIVTKIEMIQELAKRRENANWKFREFVKFRLPQSDKALDAKVCAVAREVSAQIDCTLCANCCRTMNPVVDEEDVARLAKRMRLNPKHFKERYVFRDEWGHDCIRGAPCPFLDGTRCSVYDDRPKSCRDFPYFDKPGFRQRMIMMVSNCSVCPITFNTVERLKRDLGFLDRLRRR